MKYFKNLIRNLLKRYGYKLSPIIIPPAFTDEYRDQKKLIGNGPVTIFDVGAHNGQTSITYLNLFNEPEIYAFEPSPASFELLKTSVANYPGVKVFNTALGNITGEVPFYVNRSSETNSLLATHSEGSNYWDDNVLDTIDTIKINATTVDEFVKNNGVEKIDILKIDTQGTEYQVIEGASRSIKQNKIKIIYLEIITMPTYQNQKHFDEILSLLRDKGFRLYNLYNYSHTIRGELRQVDAIFIHRSFK